ncbi:sugar transporter [Coprinellus micaceus]|uniref:Sugar transporter n=1 Tax=Coprinellus micaceus TaxID=71717 RepID=A0A4Y7T7R2_COPMI|nr:sugar transporter [Coprinellus micaceus]
MAIFKLVKRHTPSWPTQTKSRRLLRQEVVTAKRSSTSPTDEKASISQHDVENFDKDAEFGGPEARRKLERKLLLKVDARMSIMIDRNNAAAARLRGFEEDLNLHDQQFPTLLSILYVGYIIMQVPSNMFLNWIGKPSLYLPACMIVWGVISILTGITHNFVGALLTRFFLGFVEAAFFPGALFLLSKWYKREELGLRTAILYVGNIISNAFGTLMASGILSGMQGKLNQAAWRWLFYIEGAITVAVAILAIFILPDFPSTSRFLSPQERALAIKRMEEDAGGINDEEETEGSSSGLWLAITDWRVWYMALALTSQVVALSFNAYFPTLAATMGYDRTVTLLLCAPPWAFAAIVTFLLARHSDKVQERFYHIIASYLVGIVGFIIAISTMNTAGRYVALFLMAQSYAGFVCQYAWISGSFPRPPSKRAVALALINAFSQLGNIAGSYVWPSGWGPTFRNSYGITIATSGLAIAMLYGFKVHLLSVNRQLDAEEKAKGVEKQGFRYIV